jgi:hypothetical protein
MWRDSDGVLREIVTSAGEPHAHLCNGPAHGKVVNIARHAATAEQRHDTHGKPDAWQVSELRVEGAPGTFHRYALDGNRATYIEP